MAHTPTPWEILFEGGVPHIVKAGPRFEGETIARTYGDFESSTIDKGNAELIVRAVNNHQALVDALRRTLEIAKGYAAEARFDGLDESWPWLVNAEAALSQVHDPGCLCESCEARS